MQKIKNIPVLQKLNIFFLRFYGFRIVLWIVNL